MACPYDEEYFLRGKQSGRSLYTDYRWLPSLTIPFARRIAASVGIQERQTILDFGCARGYLVKAFRILGYDARGVDVSPWAIENCDPDVKNYVRLGGVNFDHTQGGGMDWTGFSPDWVVAKDCLEHVPPGEIETLLRLVSAISIGLFIVVPLADHTGKYVIGAYEDDSTHIVRWRLGQWTDFVIEHLGPRWQVTSQYHMPGIKDSWVQWETGNGFVTAKKVK